MLYKRLKEIHIRGFGWSKSPVGDDWEHVWNLAVRRSLAFYKKDKDTRAFKGT